MLGISEGFRVHVIFSRKLVGLVVEDILCNLQHHVGFVCTSQVNGVVRDSGITSWMLPWAQIVMEGNSILEMGMPAVSSRV